MLREGMEVRKRLSKLKAKRRGRLIAQIFCAVVAIVVLVCGAGLSVASAFSSSSLAFGIGTETNKVTTDVAVLAGTASQASSTKELTTAAAFDISSSVDSMNEKAAAELAAIAAQQAAANAQKLAEVEALMEHQRNTVGIPNLPDVDWSVGEEAFVLEWTERINAYLDGYPLAGQGETFARAAWEYCVDPRWSPAISMIESTKGKNCFRYHNAWGWSECSWYTWESAIWDHVRGLSERYGYTVSRSYAKMYCPTNDYNWYYNVLDEMRSFE